MEIVTNTCYVFGLISVNTISTLFYVSSVSKITYRQKCLHTQFLHIHCSVPAYSRSVQALTRCVHSSFSKQVVQWEFCQTAPFVHNGFVRMEKTVRQFVESETKRDSSFHTRRTRHGSRVFAMNTVYSFSQWQKYTKQMNEKRNAMRTCLLYTSRCV